MRFFNRYLVFYSVLVLIPEALLIPEVLFIPPTYQWNGVTCQQCRPGTFVKQHCTREKETQCEACPALYYTQYWNYVDKCRYCNVFCAEKQIETQQCNATHNRKCECESGYYLDFEFCTRHSPCPPGSGVVRNGTPYQDVTCAPCEEGYFSSKSSSTQPCQKHKECGEGLLVSLHGSESHDTLCTTCDKYETHNGTVEGTAGNGDCDTAVVQFVAYQEIHPRKLRRLFQLTRGYIKREAEEKGHLSQKHLMSLLSSIKQNVNGTPFINVILPMLEKAKLHNIVKKVKGRFLN
ncbi:tumor necrosis factor receptor superfamily member 6B-like isoform X2 [Acipenser ruthenus]|uniref:tumor necrosis factor receptor superfamily member 6B-like isoform X2 n=1 Tax=Acipenser ruthenus TaxID=7906 RepID=UPI0027420B1F|nr:tumor necrosis factor receptor superfamily member 6B-like isoform X2 [Acipenser ruthenus]